MKKWNDSIKGDPMASSIVVKTKKVSSTAEKRKAEVVRLLLSIPVFSAHQNASPHAELLFRFISGSIRTSISIWRLFERSSRMELSQR